MTHELDFGALFVLQVAGVIGPDTPLRIAENIDYRMSGLI